MLPMKFANYKSFGRYVRNSRAEKILVAVWWVKNPPTGRAQVCLPWVRKNPAGGNGTTPVFSRLGNLI